MQVNSVHHIFDTLKLPKNRRSGGRIHNDEPRNRSSCLSSSSLYEKARTGFRGTRRFFSRRTTYKDWTCTRAPLSGSS